MSVHVQYTAERRLLSAVFLLVPIFFYDVTKNGLRFMLFKRTVGGCPSYTFQN